jgi:hypothetical protein
VIVVLWYVEAAEGQLFLHVDERGALEGSAEILPSDPHIPSADAAARVRISNLLGCRQVEEGLRQATHIVDQARIDTVPNDGEEAHFDESAIDFVVNLSRCAAVARRGCRDVDLRDAHPQLSSNAKPATPSPG